MKCSRQFESLTLYNFDLVMHLLELQTSTLADMLKV